MLLKPNQHATNKGKMDYYYSSVQDVVMPTTYMCKFSFGNNQLVDETWSITDLRSFLKWMDMEVYMMLRSFCSSKHTKKKTAAVRRLALYHSIMYYVIIIAGS